ncbi:mechanosensitive ion channel family protein [Saccharospirillum sp. MSK14-1]|uniref:mechanosensitive ion channel family protein n=1 Tax=Saccharospirillum sp. MSK14-1 TaxID=1897632 RepID=UPI0018EE8CEF|nr:mechanosensitive ion channel family protein [Saccharospirillum sp. MSK14-1]
MDVFDPFTAYLPSWVLTLGIVLVSIGALLLVKRLILGHLIRITDKTRYYFDSLLLRSIKMPLTLIIIWVGLLPFDQSFSSDLPVLLAIQGLVQYVLPILLIFAVVIFVDRLVSGLITHYSKRSRLLLSSQSIVKGVSRSFIIGLGVLILLGTMGISITPIIASLGIGSLALALALQPTLENFFSGMQLVMDKPIQVGDYIELESGEQGFVERIGWRSTWIKMLPNNSVIMPNSMLSESKIINYFQPTKELSVPVEVSVHYDSDLEQVERVVLEVARDILVSHEYGVESYNTFVLFHTFSDSSINLTVMLRAHEYFHRFFIKSAFIKALHKRFKEEGIVIPYPIRAINTDQEAAHFSLHNKEP